MTIDPRDPVLGVLLAGGASRRMGGGDKCLMPLAGRALLDHVIERVAPQVDRLVLSANGDPNRFAEYGLTVIADAPAGNEGDALLGPLAGIAAALEWAADQAQAWPVIATFPTDAPFLPRDLVARMAAAAAAMQADLACAAGGGRAQPVIGLWPTALRHDLKAALAEGLRKVDQWTARYRLAEVAFEVGEGVPDPFFNVNRAEDLAQAERVLASRVA
ncbi:MAG: molybdenum cofactor guanylyltransferase MobA [Alphaproteobacteria bacterium]|nr:molybdenum cofactor guanylyltransferase MobA [Alphaproteobacteria bacterium]MCZ6763814.1 molybdenum cofactor guanylyltransferase MobA [Alphaproteobacteria bacterium]